MKKLRCSTAGESHGKGLTGIIEGLPAGLKLDEDSIEVELKRRQSGYGRGGRMKIESDRAEILSGVRWGKTLGSPVTLYIKNRDWINWSEVMSPEEKHEGTGEPVVRPRPGHADLTGALKYGHQDIRNVLERSSARETAVRVALGATAKSLLSEFGIQVGSYIIRIGNASLDTSKIDYADTEALLALYQKAEASEMRCPDSVVTARMKEAVDRAIEDKNSLGGIFEVFVAGCPPGLGDYTTWEGRLEAELARYIMSIQAIKSIEIGRGADVGGLMGSEVMDEIFCKDRTYIRKTNNAGGIEGGMTNGMPVVLRAAMKPIPTLRRPLGSVNFWTGEPMEAAYERSDVCAAPAASTIAEAMAALVIADAFLDKFGGNSVDEIRRNYASYKEHLIKR